MLNQAIKTDLMNSFIRACRCQRREYVFHRLNYLDLVFLFCMSTCNNLVVVVLHYSVFTAEEKGGRVVYSRVNYSIVV